MGVDARAEVFYGFRYADLPSEIQDKIYDMLEYDSSSEDEEDAVKRLVPDTLDPEFFKYPNDLGQIYATMYDGGEATGFGVRLAWMDWDFTHPWKEITEKVQWGLATHRISTDTVLDSMGVPEDVRDVFVQCYMG